MGLFWWCFLLRALNSLLLRTTFAPDEHWQSQEVAHRIVFGYGHLTWEWAAGLRTYAHPALYAPAYWLLKVLGLDAPLAVIKAPGVVQAGFAALADVHVYRLSRLMFGEEPARWALLCQLASWFNWYCLVRTYSNSLEASLAIVGVYHLACCRMAHGPASLRHQRLWLACAALSVVLRPPSALAWAPLALEALWRQRRRGGAGRLLLHGMAAGAGCMLAAAGIDRLAYGRWVPVPWNFLKFNLLEGGSGLYGSHPWHWGVTQGLPAVAATLLPLAAAGLVTARGAGVLARALAWSVAAYSLPAHKEFRFLLPALQLAMPYAGLGVRWLWCGPGGKPAPARGRRGRRVAVAACLVLQAAMAWYFSRHHHRGLVDVMHDIRRAGDEGNAASVLFLTPCHATPFYTHVHRPLGMAFLDCSPPGWQQAVDALNPGRRSWLALPPACAPARGVARSERACFEADPAGYLGELLQLNSGALPSLVVGYADALAPLAPLLERHGYMLRHTYRNCWVQTDDGTPCVLLLYAR